jgi:predicted Zn-dependent peptidase
VPHELLQQTYPNGFTLLAERMDHVRSASLYLMIQSGYVHEPANRLGLAGILAEMLTRGAGKRDSKQLSLALDNLGADRSEGAGGFNITLSAGTLARNLPAVLELVADIVRRPWLPDDEVESAVELALQDLQGLDDSPSDLCLLELKRRYYPQPFCRNQYGTPETLGSITAADVKQFHAERFKPNRAILSVAGKIDWPSLKDQVGMLFADWSGSASAPLAQPGHVRQSGHVTKETNQTQIAVAYPTAAFGTPDFYAARGAIGILSGGMSSRLFTEVREKRGLCYSVSATYDQVKDLASVVCYAGSRVEKAQETLDVTIGELKRLREGISAEEVDRMRAGLKTTLVMQQESTSSRAGSMATDWFYLNRVRPVDEVQAAIDALTPATILAHLDRFPAKDFTVVTLGPKALNVPG